MWPIMITEREMKMCTVSPMIELTPCQKEVLRGIALLEARKEKPTHERLAKLMGITKGGVAYHKSRLRALGVLSANGLPVLGEVG